MGCGIRRILSSVGGALTYVTGLCVTVLVVSAFGVVGLGGSVGAQPLTTSCLTKPDPSGSNGACPVNSPSVAGYSMYEGSEYAVTSQGAVYDQEGQLAGMNGSHLVAPIVGVVGTSVVDNGPSYWLVAKDGGVFSFGGAPFYGSLGGQRLNAPVAGMVSVYDGAGYWLVSSDGGVFSFGSAQFYGSTGGQQLNAPVVGMAASPDGKGYWLVASDGGVFSFGDATFYGSMGGQRLDAPVVGIAPTDAAIPRGGGRGDFYLRRCAIYGVGKGIHHVARYWRFSGRRCARPCQSSEVGRIYCDGFGRPPVPVLRAPGSSGPQRE